MGGAASNFTKSEAAGTPELKTFITCFAAMAAKGDMAKASRVQAWGFCDPNGNNLASLAEVDGWIQKTLMSFTGDNDKGTDIWKMYRPSFIRAFNDAKDIADPEKGAKAKKADGTEVNKDDYVSPPEFRLLNAYLCIYAYMYDAFSLVDGGGAAGANMDANDDRRMDEGEWVAAYTKVYAYGFAGVSKETCPDDAAAKAMFAKMDADGKGKVLLNEFCKFLEKKEQEAGTEWGKMLAVGDD